MMDKPTIPQFFLRLFLLLLGALAVVMLFHLSVDISR